MFSVCECKSSYKRAHQLQNAELSSSSCSQEKKTSHCTTSLPPLPLLPSSSVTPKQWSSFSNENILKTEKACNASSTLRGVIGGVLEQAREDIERQKVTVNLEFSKRIFEINHVKSALEERLAKV